MNTFLKTGAAALAISLAATVAMSATSAQANVIVPANDATGVVTAVDEAAGELTIAGQKYNAAQADLHSLQIGTEVTVQYFTDGDKMFALWVMPKAPNAGNRADE